MFTKLLIDIIHYSAFTLDKLTDKLELIDQSCYSIFYVSDRLHKFTHESKTVVFHAMPKQLELRKIEANMKCFLPTENFSVKKLCTLLLTTFSADEVEKQVSTISNI